MGKSATLNSEGGNMGIGVSIILIAVGAILTWAVSAEASGIDIQTVGVILLVVGLVGFLLSLVFWSSVGSWGPWRRETVVREDRFVERPY
jgi:apolipoprotein N-acyltransferase